MIGPPCWQLNACVYAQHHVAPPSPTMEIFENWITGKVLGYKSGVLMVGLVSLWKEVWDLALPSCYLAIIITLCRHNFKNCLQTKKKALAKEQHQPGLWSQSFPSPDNKEPFVALATLLYDIFYYISPKWPIQPLIHMHQVEALTTWSQMGMTKTQTKIPSLCWYF